MWDENGTQGENIVAQDKDVTAISAPYFLILQSAFLLGRNKEKQKSLLI